MPTLDYESPGGPEETGAAHRPGDPPPNEARYLEISREQVVVITIALLVIVGFAFFCAGLLMGQLWTAQ